MISLLLVSLFPLLIAFSPSIFQTRHFTTPTNIRAKANVIGSTCLNRNRLITLRCKTSEDTSSKDEESSTNDEVGEEEEKITSKEIVRLEKKIEELTSTIAAVRAGKVAEEGELAKLDAEFGPEIARIKNEFSRMKDRSVEEAVEISNKAKTDALKEVLPITDNYFRAKSLFEPIQSEGELAILNIYDNIFASFQKVIEGFGVSRVISIGQPFDPAFMEAIMTAPSTEYASDIVCTEYQVGYRMGDKCIRPSMVVVSVGPGP